MEALAKKSMAKLDVGGTGVTHNKSMAIKTDKTAKRRKTRETTQQNGGKERHAERHMIMNRMSFDGVQNPNLERPGAGSMGGFQEQILKTQGGADRFLPTCLRTHRRIQTSIFPTIHFFLGQFWVVQSSYDHIIKFPHRPDKHINT